MAKKSKNNSGETKAQKVAELLEKNMTELGYPEPLVETALRVWEIFFASEQPQVRSPGAYAASIEYTLTNMHVVGMSLTQKDVAQRYQTTAASVSRISQLLLDFLATVPAHEYIPEDLMVPEGLAVPGWEDDEPLALDELIPPPIFEMVKHLPKTNETWISGRRNLNTYITDPTPRRPDVILIADASGHPLLGQMLIEAEAPPMMIVPAIVRTILEPSMGEPRRPACVTIANEALVTTLQNALEPFDIEVKFGAAQVVDALVTLLETHLNTPDDDEPPESYTGNGRVTEDDVATFFEAAAHLYRTAPWDFAYDSQVLAIDLHRWGFERVTVSILGAARQTFGLLVLENAESFMALEMMSHAREHVQAEKLQPPPINIMAIEFERGGDLPSSLRQEILQHGWEVADPKAYPTLQNIESYRLVRPNNSEDYLAATAICHAVAEFTKHYKPLFQKETPKTSRMKIDLPMMKREAPVTVIYPHPDYMELCGEIG